MICFLARHDILQGDELSQDYLNELHKATMMASILRYSFLNIERFELIQKMLNTQLTLFHCSQSKKSLSQKLNALFGRLKVISLRDLQKK